jgi:YfiR/HmsC-like
MEQVIDGRFRHRFRGIYAWLRNAAILPLLACSLSVPQFGAQPADDPLEYRIKAAFLLNFTKFIDWPEESFTEPSAPIALCIMGDAPMRATLNQLAVGELVKGRKIAVRSLNETAAPKYCQILFFTAVEKDTRPLSGVLPGQLPGSLNAAGPGVLTVGEGEGFIRDGGMIAFVIENNRVRFEINQTAAENAGLKLSSKLLSVAKAIIR